MKFRQFVGGCSDQTGAITIYSFIVQATLTKFDGFINKVILLLITMVVLMESYQLGVLFILGFFVIYTGLQMNNNQVVEGFHNYFEDTV